MKTKSYKECCSEVAIKHKLGKSLVAGHLVKYWEEAAEIYASQHKNQTEGIILPETFQDETFIEHEISYQHHGVVRMAIFKYKVWLKERMADKTIK